MGEHNSMNEERLNRRRLLKSIGAAGGTLSAVQIGSARTDDGQIIAITRDFDGNPVDTRRVPKEWHNNVSQSKTVANSLKKKFIGNSSVVSIGIGNSDTSIQGLNKKEVKITILDEAVTNSIPRSMRGINIRVNTISDIEYYDCYWGNHDKFEGGIGVAIGGTETSMCSRVEVDSTQYMMTARHPFTPDGSGHCGSISKDNVWDKDGIIGTYSGSCIEHDVSWVSPSTGIGLDNSIVDETAEIHGYVSNSGHENFASNGEELDVRGANSCTDTCQVYSVGNTVSYDGCTQDLQDQVFYENHENIGPGDSGGIVYHVNDSGDAFLSGVISGGATIDCGWYCEKEVIRGSEGAAIRDHCIDRIH